VCSRLDTIAHVSLGILAFADMGPEWKFAAYKGGALASMMSAISRLIGAAASKQEYSDLSQAWNAVASIFQTDNAALLFLQHGGVDIACQSICSSNSSLSLSAATACDSVLKQMPVRLGQPFGDSVFLKLLDSSVSARCEEGCVSALITVHGMLLRLQEANALRLQPWHVRAILLVTKARVQRPTSKLVYPPNRRSLFAQLGIFPDSSKKSARAEPSGASKTCSAKESDCWIWPGCQETLLKILMMLTLLGDEVGVDMINQGIVAALSCWWGGSMEVYEILKPVAVADEKNAQLARCASAPIANLLSPKPKTPNIKLKRVDTAKFTPWGRGDAWPGMQMADWLVLPYFGCFDTGTALEDYQILDDAEATARLPAAQPRLMVQSHEDFNSKVLSSYASTSSALLRSLQDSLTLMSAEQQQLLLGNCVLNEGGLDVQLLQPFEALKDDVLKNAIHGLDVLYELLLQRQHPSDAWVIGQLQPLNIIVRILERILKDGASAISSTTGMFIYPADNKVFKKALRMLNTILSVQSIHPCLRTRSCKLAAAVGAIGILQRALQFAPKAFHSLAVHALSSILAVAPVAARFHDLGGSFLIMCSRSSKTCSHSVPHLFYMSDEMLRVMDAGNKSDDISKFDRLLRLLPLCGALARHRQNLELIVAGGRCSLAAAVLNVVVYALPPAVCSIAAAACVDLKGCSSLQEEMYSLTDVHPCAVLLLRRVSFISTVHAACAAHVACT
jgi:hypothetical protein